MPGLYTLVATRVDGETLTAAKYNADEQNHIDNQELQKTDDFSASVGQMQSTTDPGEAGTESLATDASGELARLRFAIKETKDALGTSVAQWYTTPGTISGLVATQSVRNLVINGDLEDWRNGTSVAPFGFTLSGGGASVTRDATNFKTGVASASVTRATNDALLQRDVITQAGGQAHIRSRAYRFSAWVRATVASRVRLRINDGIGSTFSSYHTGGGAFERLSVTRTLDAAATALNIGLSVDTGDTTGQIDSLMLTEGTAEVAFVLRGANEIDDRVSMFTASGTFGVPEGVTEVTVLVVAAGGGGGSGAGTTSDVDRAGGGGGGAAGEGLLLRHAVTQYAQLTVTIGTGGTGGAGQTGTGNGNPGAAGGNSVFDTLTARGGPGGSAGLLGSGAAGVGGAGGVTPTAAAGTGVGGGTPSGVVGGPALSGSGGAGGTTADATNAAGGGGGGGCSPIGPGGAGSNGVTLSNSAAGSAAVSLGAGGGGGGGASGGDSGAGGNGTNGFVLVWW